MATKIVTKNSSTASAVPTASDLVQGELAVNVADKRLFTEDNGGAIVELGTNPSTLTVTGEITANGGIALGDNDKATFGAGDDLQIYHDGSNSFITDANGIGNLILRGSANVQIEGANGENCAIFNENGSVRLFNDSFEKLATTSTGIDVTGTATMDGLTVDGSQVLVASVNNSSATAGTGGLKVNTASVSSSTIPFYVRSNDLNRLRVKGNGDFELFEDTGTTAKLFWDASAESLGIGTSSPAFGAISTGIEVEGTTAGIRLQGATTGALELYHNNGLSTIDSRAATGGSKIAFNTENTERMRIDSSGRVGIGTSSPSGALEVVGGASLGSGFTQSRSGHPTFGITNGGTDSVYFSLAPNGGSHQTFMQVRDDDTDVSSVAFSTSGSEAMRIDSSGNLLVGKTSADTGATVGFEYSAADKLYVTDSASSAIVMNRLASDGNIAVFQKDGTTVGSIGTKSSDLYIGKDASGLLFDVTGADGIRPFNTTTQTESDNALDLGSSDTRFKDLYLSGGVYLGGTGAANKLEDYEEGTWTPTISHTSGFNGSTITSVDARYTKIGRKVTIEFEFLLDSSTGNVAEGDDVILPASCLPFTPSFNGHASGTFGAQSNMSIGEDIAMGYAGLSGANNLGLIVHTVDGTCSRNSTTLGGIATYITNS